MKTTTRNLLTLASLIAAVFASAGAIAQTGPGRGGMQPATATMQGRALERFQAADTDKDGALNKDEASKGMPGLGERFAALDTNQDGKITTEEFQTFRNNARSSGAQGGMGARGGMHKASYRGQGSQGGMLLNADTDKDGVITRAEAEKYLTTQALNRFDTLDTNKDGKLSAEEQAAGRGPRR
ncbi:MULTISPECIES: EF-hand domain-containing protein [unclassified Uliginosibacterium]|uniref:EF-hand domain-containing protein n=1 Tax=unclassified Uliginosibacterium TaxID=2621521 RepID=UPI0013045F23|nr:MULTISPECIES: EF-hand domain-containing protein [unclassified Uliginosibacterium]MDO6384734.1 EF-hand domain-containing protein [Uliginosibacterium sp. 31-12]